MNIYDEALRALVLVLYLSLPTVVAAAGIGVFVSLFQALTQIQDQTMQHAVKLAGVVIVLIATATWAGSQIMTYTDHIFLRFAAGR